MMVIHALIFLALITLISSPYELARLDDQDNMVEVLSKLRNVAAEDVIREAHLITKDVEDEKTTRKTNTMAKIKNMDKSTIKNLGIILVVFGITHFSGITVLNTFLVDIFSSSGISEIVLVLVTGCSEMGFSFFQMVVADKLGR